MNEKLKKELEEIKGIGQQIAMVESTIADNEAKLNNLSHFADTVKDMPAVKAAADKTVEELAKEIKEEQQMVDDLKAKLPR